MSVIEMFHRKNQRKKKVFYSFATFCAAQFSFIVRQFFFGVWALKKSNFRIIFFFRFLCRRKSEFIGCHGSVQMREQEKEILTSFKRMFAINKIAITENYEKSVFKRRKQKVDNCFCIGQPFLMQNSSSVAD